MLMAYRRGFFGENGGKAMFFTDLPLGFGMTLAENEAALNAFNGLTAQQKQAVIDKARGAQTAKEIHALVASLQGKDEAL